MRVNVADARAAERSDAATVNVRLLLTEWLEAFKKRKQAEQSEVLKKKKKSFGRFQGQQLFLLQLFDSGYDQRSEGAATRASSEEASLRQGRNQDESSFLDLLAGPQTERQAVSQPSSWP